VSIVKKQEEDNADSKAQGLSKP